ncbi:MAG TPA: glycoside hydrolase family 88 protein [Pseudacidobacterium sp.]|jgi:unsaturated rhamnogalacturonyl hydrolase|nr:glycoside hydrolase family 88 protein [Pseudacidobacterium sp.]
MRTLFTYFLLSLFPLGISLQPSYAAANSDDLAWSQRTADTTVQRWPKGRFLPEDKPWKWNYELGVLLQGMDDAWYHTANGAYYKYVKESVDALVNADGSIPTYNAEDYQLDDLALGHTLLLLYGVTQDAKYYKAATTLRQQLATHPRTSDGGFWHKQKYPNQMWLDGLYMAQPFYAEYAKTFQQPQDFDDITKQFVLMEQHARDPKTGLFYHGWNETKQQLWANKITGTSPNFWARGMGWYMMALVDTLPYYNDDDPGRAKLLAILQRLATAVVKYQDKDSGLWYQVMDKAGAKDNYTESSASCMFTYALAKGVRLGYLQPTYLSNAQRGYQGILKQFVKTDADGQVTLTGTVRAIGLGTGSGNDGSYSYYTSQEVVSNDPKGVGAFLMTSTEIEASQTASLGRGKTVLLDAWFNSQTRKNAAGQTVLYHYKWDDFANSGYSLFGHMLRDYGLKTDTIPKAPTVEDLSTAQIYLIVSPDNLDWNKNPHFMNEADASQIAKWVKNGGMLVIMENDPTHADIEHLDILADKFGMHFNNVQRNGVEGNKYEMGRIDVDGDGPVFHSPHILFIKEICTITPKDPTVAVWRDKGDVLLAKAKYGKGVVIGLVDPWLYNEYTDGRKLPPPYDNFAGGKEYIRWLVEQVPTER